MLVETVSIEYWYRNWVYSYLLYDKSFNFKIEPKEGCSKDKFNIWSLQNAFSFNLKKI